MLAPKKYSRKKIITITSLIIFIWIIIFVLIYWNFWRSSSDTTSLSAIDTPAKRPAPISSQLKLGSEVLEDKRFINLKIFGSLPLQVGEVGRVDPFSIPKSKPIQSPVRRP